MWTVAGIAIDCPDAAETRINTQFVGLENLLAALRRLSFFSTFLASTFADLYLLHSNVVIKEIPSR